MAAGHFNEVTHSWKEAVARYVAEVMPGAIKPSTAERYMCSFRQVDPYLSEKTVDKIDRSVLARVAARKGPSNATKRRDLTAISAVLDACVTWGWVDGNATLTFDRRIIRERRKPLAIPLAEDIEAVIEAAPPMVAAITRVAWKTGMRQMEVVNLKRRHLRMSEPAIYLPTSKTNVPRVVPLDDPVCREAVGTLTGTPVRLGCDWVFWHSEGSPYRNFASNFRAVQARLNARRKKQGLPPISFRFHDLRHRFAVDYLEATRSSTMRRGDVYRLAEILSHASVKMTEGYLNHVTPIGTNPGTRASIPVKVTSQQATV